MKAALLVIDVQKEFFAKSPAAAKSLSDAVGCINAALDLFRAKQWPVLVIQHKNEETGLVPGADGFELPETLRVEASDRRIVKTYGNSFAHTSLLDELRAMAVDTVIITGYCAEQCVLSTYRGAKDLDLRPIMLRGALASGQPERIRFVEEISDIVSLGALKIFLES